MRIATILATLALTACGDAPTSGDAREGNAIVAAEPAPAIATDVAPPAPRPGHSAASTSPVAAIADAVEDGAAAASVVRRYHALIAEDRAADAYSLWEPGAAGIDREAFVKSFARYAVYRAAVGRPGRVDAGAGQRYVEVPVRIEATLRAGGSVVLDGTMTLHRTAAIDGASAEQQRWRIRQSSLRQSATTSPATTTARFRCMDGSRLAAAFDNRAETVTLRRGGERIGILDQQRAASGIWYRRGGIEWRGKGDMATFTEPGRPPIACTAIR